MENVKLLKNRIDVIDFDGAINYCVERVNQGLNTHVVTLNPEMVELTARDCDFLNILTKSDLSIADGVGIKLAFKFKSIDIQNIRGVDFSKKLLSKSADYGYRVALLGAKEEVLKYAVENIKSWFPNINVVYAHNGYFDNPEQIKNEIISAKPNLLLVALGAPKQEYFIRDIYNSLNSCIMVGVGGSFDVYSGLTKEAPEIYRKYGIEWLYRTISDPKRFKRIFPTLPIFLIKSIIESVKEKFFIYD